MAKARSKDQAKTRQRKMTRDEILAFNAKLEADPEIQAMIARGLAASARGEGIRFSELKRKYARH